VEGYIGAAFFEVRCYALSEICYCITQWPLNPRLVHS
jgi:hypothetical protein